MAEPSVLYREVCYSHRVLLLKCLFKGPSCFSIIYNTFLLVQIKLLGMRENCHLVRPDPR